MDPAANKTAFMSDEMHPKVNNTFNTYCMNKYNYGNGLLKLMGHNTNTGLMSVTCNISHPLPKKYKYNFKWNHTDERVKFIGLL